MSISENQTVIKECWSEFIKQGTINPQVRPFIAESWKRCWNYGLGDDLEGKVSETFVNELLDENRLLIDAAWPFLLHMKDLVKGSQHAITLHDRMSRVIARVFAGDLLIFTKASFNIGVQWSEERMGTAGPNLCIRLDQELQVIGAEHYNRQLSGVTCSSAPIHDKSGAVIGCINMTGRIADSNPYTLGLVSAMAFAVENSLELMRGTKIAEDTFSAVAEGIIVLNENFRVMQVSRYMCSLFKLTEKELKSLDFRMLLAPEDFAMRLQVEKEPFLYPEYKLHIGSRSIPCAITVLPIHTHGKYMGTVLFFQESRTIARLTGQMAGNQSHYTFDDIVTKDENMKRMIQMIGDVAKTDCTILLEGESGTGKELFAHSIHMASGRAKGPFVAVNCASLPGSLAESELFGYEKGAFTGANGTGNPGKFELANGGTIFLDEIGELPLEIQAKLLRVLDNHQVMRIGGRSERPLDVRVLAATNRDLYTEVQKQNFRSDLYFRINVIRFEIPPLNKRGKDVLVLADKFLHELNRKENGVTKKYTSAFVNMLMSYHWPGNVRELHNVIVRAYYCSSGSDIDVESLPSEITQLREAAKKNEIVSVLPDEDLNNVQKFEKLQIAEAMERNHGDAAAAGAELGFSKSTIYRRIRKYHIYK